ncbi:hypothetical protein MPNT_20068 [Candidatus Methylacidithermus pantelleriae]|uniref:Uncharacterized protein n=1 Tax=Candidatus Methylacidithermus pantelleriae TaxID=2744239 RepID=A0A8J2BSR6_9BACT|nr:hypothetical protein MPNT_20068 [Candidatus Methylacidithermus pantelleriae]
MADLERAHLATGLLNQGQANGARCGQGANPDPGWEKLAVLGAMSKQFDRRIAPKHRPTKAGKKKRKAFFPAKPVGSVSWLLLLALCLCFKGNHHECIYLTNTRVLSQR